MAVNQDQKPAATVAGDQLPKAKQTILGLYVTAAQAYEMWKAAPDSVKVIDVRTPEEFAFVGHPQMAWNVPLAFVSYQRQGGKFTYAPQMNTAFVDGVEGDTVNGPESVFHGKRMKNGGKNSAPWLYDVDPEKIIIEEGASQMMR